MDKLLPCPFCGGDATIGANEYYDAANTFYVYCQNCGVQQTTTKIRIDEAEAVWNRRAEQESQLATNADRIRGMSDKELARWLVDATVCERVCDEDEYCHGNECVKRVTDWLTQPAETEGKE